VEKVAFKLAKWRRQMWRRSWAFGRNNKPKCWPLDFWGPDIQSTIQASSATH